LLEPVGVLETGNAPAANDHRADSNQQSSDVGDPAPWFDWPGTGFGRGWGGSASRSPAVQSVDLDADSACQPPRAASRTVDPPGNFRMSGTSITGNRGCPEPVFAADRSQSRVFLQPPAKTAVLDGARPPRWGICSLEVEHRSRIFFVVPRRTTRGPPCKMSGLRPAQQLRVECP